MNFSTSWPTANSLSPLPAVPGLMRVPSSSTPLLLVEFNKSGVLELGTRMSPGTAGNGLKEFAVGQLVEKFMQVPLNRLHRLLQDKQHYHRKAQLPLSSKVLRPHSM